MSRERIGAYAAFLSLVTRGAFWFDDTGRAWKPSAVASRVASRANRNGYRRVPFHLGGQRFEVMEHVAYWIWKTGKWPGKKQVNHKDLDRSNGRLENLELVTQAQNLRHAHAARKAGLKGGKR